MMWIDHIVIDFFQNAFLKISTLVYSLMISWWYLIKMLTRSNPG